VTRRYDPARDIAEALTQPPRVVGTCRVCGLRNVPLTRGGTCVDEVACFEEFRRREGWTALDRLCAHADQDGRGAHWLAAGEECDPEEDR
jgi:hypothetical protein